MGLMPPSEGGDHSIRGPYERAKTASTSSSSRERLYRHRVRRCRALMMERTKNGTSCGVGRHQ